MEVLLLDKDFNYCKELMNAISSINQKVRISFIANSMEEILDRFDIDVVLANYEFCSDELESKFDVSKIIYLSDYTDSRSGTISRENIDLIIQSVERKINYISDGQLDTAINGELALIGYNFSLIGTNCLREAIKVLYRTDGNYYTKNLEIEVYPVVARKFNLSAHTVKNNITYASSKMFDENDLKKLHRYFGFKFTRRPGTKTIMYAILENISTKLPF